MSGSGTYDVTLNPGATQPIMAAGGYCKVISAPTGAVQLKLDTGETWTVNEGQGFRMPDGQEFARILVTNKASLAQTILVLIGDASFEDSRITGDVRIIDLVQATCQAVTGGIALAVTAFRADTILAANVSTGGALLRSIGLNITGGAGGQIQTRIVAAAAQPASFAGAAAQLVLAEAISVGAVQQGAYLGDLHKRLPANWGVWAITAITTNPATAASFYSSLET